MEGTKKTRRGRYLGCSGYGNSQGNSHWYGESENISVYYKNCHNAKQSVTYIDTYVADPQKLFMEFLLPPH